MAMNSGFVIKIDRIIRICVYLRKLLYKILFTAIIVGILVGFFLPKKWRFKAEIYVSPGTSEMSLFTTGESRPLSIVKGLFLSESVTAELANKFSISKKDVRDILNVSIENENSILTISSESTDLIFGKEVLFDWISFSRTYADGLAKDFSANPESNISSLIADKQRQIVKAERQLAEQQESFRVGVNVNGPLELKLSREYSYLKEEKAAKSYALELKRNSLLSDLRDGYVNLNQLEGFSELRQIVAKTQSLRNDVKFRDIDSGVEDPVLKKSVVELEIASSQLFAEMSSIRKSIEAGTYSQIKELVSEVSMLDRKMKQVAKMIPVEKVEALQLSGLVRDVKRFESELSALYIARTENKLRERLRVVEWTVLSSPFVEEKPVSRGPVRLAFELSLSVFIIIIVYIIFRFRRFVIWKNEL
jgi:hypothetical protein